MESKQQHQTQIKSALEALLNTVQQNPEIWGIRKEAARLLFDNGRYKEAADIVWAAPDIPAVDLEIAFAARVLSRDQPGRAIRLLQFVMERVVENPAKLLAIANALMHYGMVMQAARFYGAATAQDSSLANGDLEYFMLWLDDSQRLWGDWEKDKQKIGELPWVKRDEASGVNFEKMMSGLTTPIKVPGLKETTAEHLVNEYYRQVPISGSDVTAPPAVTVPLGQLKPDDVIHDDKLGATITPPKGSQKVVRKLPQSILEQDASPVTKTLPAKKLPEIKAAKALPDAGHLNEKPADAKDENPPAADEPKKPKILFERKAKKPKFLF